MPQLFGSLITKFRWFSRSDSLGIPSPFVRSQGWEAWHGLHNLHNSARTSLLLLFSSLRVTHLVSMGFEFIMIMPLLQSCCNSLDVRYLLFGGLQHPPVNGCSTASCNFGVLAGGDEHTSLLCHLEPKVPTLLTYRLKCN